MKKRIKFMIGFAVLALVRTLLARPRSLCTLDTALNDIAEARRTSVEDAIVARKPCARIADRSTGGSTCDARVWDVFPFNSEIDILEIRLHELFDVVHRFVITECPFSEHDGSPKEITIHSKAFQDRLAFAHHKIIYADCNRDHLLLKLTDDMWNVNAIPYVVGFQAIPDLRADDVVITGDLDEIPSARSVALACSRPDVRKWLTSSTMVMYTTHSIFRSDWETAMGGDFRFPIVVRGSEVKSISSLLQLRLEGKAHRERFEILPEGVHFTWPADPLLFMKRLRTNLETHDMGRQKDWFFNHTIILAELEDFLYDLYYDNGNKFNQKWAHRIQKDEPNWLPGFYLKNKNRFAFTPIHQ